MTAAQDPYDQGHGSSLVAWEKLAQAKARGAEYDSNGRQHFSQCLPGTRQELLGALYDAMTGDTKQIVCLVEESGSGKSSVAHTMARQLSAQNQLAATFFFSRTYTGRGDTSLVFPTLAYQIGLLHPRAKWVIVKAINDDPELLSGTKSRAGQLEHLVKAPLRCLRLVWETPREMIFDAVDEGVTGDGTSLEALILAMNELIRDPSIPVSHVLVTSRPSPPFNTLSQSLASQGLLTTFDMERFSYNRDIDIFLKHSFDKIYDIRDLTFLHSRPWPSSTVISSLSARIKGRFIVAATIVRLVENAESPSECLDLIAKMYAGAVDTIDLDLGDIDSIYRYVLISCEDRYQRSGAEYLSIIVALAKPLALSDICALSGTDVLKHILHLSAIVDIPPNAMRSSVTVRVYHASIRDYLWDAPRSGDFHVSPSSLHGRLAVWCLQFLKRKLKRYPWLFRFMQRKLPRRDAQAVTDEEGVKSPLLYAVSYWSYHLKLSEPSRQLQALVLDFVRNRAMLYLETAAAMRQFSKAMSCLVQAKFTVMRWKPFSGQHEIMSLLDSYW